MSATTAKPHILTAMAKVHGQQVTYPAEKMKNRAAASTKHDLQKTMF